MEQFKDEHTEGPDIRFWAVDVVDQALRRHVDGRSDVDVLEFRFGKLCEPEICDFGLAVVDEDVGDFEIAMDDVIIGQIDEASENVADVCFCFEFFHGFFGSQFGLQIALVAQLGDNVAVAIAGEDFVALQHVGMLQFLQNLNFREE